MTEQPQSPRSAHSFEVLDNRVSGLERSISMVLDRIEAQASKTDAAIAALRDAMAASKVPQWPVILSFIGTGVVIVTALWGAGINPIKTSIAALDQSVAGLADEFKADVGALREGVATVQRDYLTISAYNDNRLLSRQERAVIDQRIEADIEKLEERFRQASDMVVPRGEHQERWRSIDAAILANREAYTGMIADLQRQIDEVSERQGAVYGQRDIILDLQDRIDNLETLLRDALVRSGTQ